MELSSGRESSGTGCWCSSDVCLLCDYYRWQPAADLESSGSFSHTQTGTNISYTCKETFDRSIIIQVIFLNKDNLGVTDKTFDAMD